MKICGEGEWKVKIHGRGRPRKWVKIHLAIPKRVLADGAYDRKQSREAIRSRNAEPLIPPPKNI